MLSLEDISAFVVRSEKKGGVQLTLRDKGLTELPALGSLNLEKILLDGNNIADLRGSVFEGCTALRNLSLDKNSLTSLKSLHCLPNLQVLSASNNQLEDFKWPENHQKIGAIIVSNNQIKKIPKNLPPSINTLVLSGNQIEKLENLDKLIQLQKLSIASNRLTALSVALQFNVGLRELRLNGNKLIRLPTSLSKNVHLRVLDIGNNLIADQNSLLVLKSLNKLRNLNIKGNPVDLVAGVKEWVLSSVPSLKVFNSKPLDDYKKEKKNLRQKAETKEKGNGKGKEQEKEPQNSALKRKREMPDGDSKVKKKLQKTNTK